MSDISSLLCRLFPVHIFGKSSAWHCFILLVFKQCQTRALSATVQESVWRSPSSFICIQCPCFSSFLSWQLHSSSLSLYPRVKQYLQTLLFPTEKINKVCCLNQSSVIGGQLAIAWGTSGMREEKKVLKKTQAVHMTDTLWGGTNTAVICSCPSDPSTAAAGSSLCLSARSTA